MLRSFWRAHRVAIPLVLAVLCLLLANFAGPIVGYLLIVAAFGFLMDGGLSMFPTAGGMGSYRQ